jgi:AcrR family transcriptional regulator
VGDLTDRRTRKKAQTRELIREVAHRLFAKQGFDVVTIVDIAREADVAVQTVFNHFATKEELFYDGRTPWITGPAEAVRTREPSVPPLTALREYLVGTVEALVASHTEPERRCYVATIEASVPLRVYERELVHETEIRLRDALVEAWSASDASAPPDDPETAAALVAASWLSTARTLVVSQRPLLTGGADPEQRAASVVALADRMFRFLESGVAVVHAGSPAPPRTDTGWPRTAVRRAG